MPPRPQDMPSSIRAPIWSPHRITSVIFSSIITASWKNISSSLSIKHRRLSWRNSTKHQMPSRSTNSTTLSKLYRRSSRIWSTWIKLRVICNRKHRNSMMVAENEFNWQTHTDINRVSFSGLRGVKRELLNALQQCRTNECKQVQKDYEIGRLDENNIHYDQVSFVRRRKASLLLSLQQLTMKYQLTSNFLSHRFFLLVIVIMYSWTVFMCAIGFSRL